MSIKSVMLSNHLILCHPLLLLLSVFPSIRVFSSESALCIGWTKYWHFIFSISPSNEHSGLISFRIDWFDLLAAWRSLKSLLQNQFFGTQSSLWSNSHIRISSVQLLSHIRLFATLWTTACQASLSITNSWSLLKLMPIESVKPSSHLILCGPLLLLPPIPPSIRVFSKSQLFAWGGQSTGVSASASVLTMNTQDWSPLGWTGWISLQSKGLSRVFSNTTVQKHQSSVPSFLHRPTLTSIHDHWKIVMCICGEGNGNPLQYSCLENPGDGSLVGCHLWGCTESDKTDVT